MQEFCGPASDQSRNTAGVAPPTMFHVRQLSVEVTIYNIIIEFMVSITNRI